jgi:predicted dehydrogenase
MKIGIVGFGKMGILHGALLSAMADVKVAAIADTSRLVCRAFRSVLPEVEYFSSAEKMMASCALDAAVITTPSFNHVPAAMTAIDRGIDFFVEKPLSNNLDNALRLGRAIHAKPVVAMVGFHMRHIPSVVKGHALLQQAGNIRQVEAELYVSDVFAPQTGWRYDPAMSGGGVVIDFTVHLLDIFHWYFGEASRVTAATRSIYSKLVEDEVEAQIVFKAGFTASLRSSWSVPGHRLPFLKMKITGDQGELTVTDHNVRLTLPDGASLCTYNAPELYSGYFYDIAGPCYSLQMEAFATAVRSRKTGEDSMATALYDQCLVDAIYRSAHSHAAVTVSVERN